MAKPNNPPTLEAAAQQLVAETRFLLKLLDSRQPDGIESVGIEGQKAVVHALCDCVMRRRGENVVHDLAEAKRAFPAITEDNIHDGNIPPSPDRCPGA